MGFFSYLCAVSGESIPADCVDPTEVLGFYPDGRVVRGVYDGYGRIGNDEYTQNLQFDKQRLAVVKSAKLLGGKSYIREKWNDTCYEMEVEFKVKVFGKGLITTTDTVSYVIKPGLSLEEAFKDRYGFIVSSQEFNISSGFLKLVKAKYYEESKHSYESLPGSKSCSYQGYFYEEEGQWNRPISDSDYEE